MGDHDCTIQSMVGARSDQIPDRISLFMLVDRDKFPQKLGPYRLVPVPFEPQDFALPELTEDFKAHGFYWDMKTGILESHGLRARSSCIIGQVSPAHCVIVEDA